MMIQFVAYKRSPYVWELAIYQQNILMIMKMHY